jgi:hypothetical protein
MLVTNKRGTAVGTPTLVAMYVVVGAFMLLSLAVTATGTARFAEAMGYDAKVGYTVGSIFDLAKALLLMALLALWGRRSLGLAAVFAIAWGGLVTFSWLATHATVSTAIGAIERNGTWKMEVRSNTKAELASVDQQLSALSRPVPPRTAKAVREALAAERVPPSVWQDSQECKAIQESAHFAKACAQVVQLRRELAAAQEYERLSARATELRGRLAEAPIVATSDPLPAAFSATLGRLLPLAGAEGVALLLTMVVELMSCFGLAGLSALYRGRDVRELGTPGARSLAAKTPTILEPEGGTPPAMCQSSSLRTLPKPSLRPVATGRASSRELRSREASRPPSNILPMRQRTSLREPLRRRKQGFPKTWAPMSLPLSGSASRRPRAVHWPRANCAWHTRHGARRTTTSRSRCQSLQPSSERLAMASGRATAVSDTAICGSQRSSKRLRRSPSTAQMNDVKRTLFGGSKIVQTDRQWTGTKG